MPIGIRPFSGNVLKRVLTKRREAIDVGWKDPYYVVTQSHAQLQNEQLHKDLTGGDLHSPKAHASSHRGGGSDPILQNGNYAGKNA